MRLSPGEPWSDWAQNPIDRFILKGLLDKGLTPAPEADRRTLIRRATFDLTGLPPTPEEVDAFLADQIARRLRAAGRPPAGLARGTASAGAGTGSTWSATPSPTAIARTRFGPTPGAIATTSSGRSTPTSPTTASSPSNSPATSSTPTTPSCGSPPGYLRLGTYEYNQRNVRGPVGRHPQRHHRRDRRGLPRPEHRLRPLPRPQVRPDPPEGLLPAPGVLHAAPAARRPDARARPRQWADYQDRLAAWEKATADLRRQIAALEAPVSREGGARARSPSSPTTSRPSCASRRRIARRWSSSSAPWPIARSPSSTTSVPALKGPAKARRDELQQAAEPARRHRPAAPPPRS